MDSCEVTLKLLVMCTWRYSEYERLPTRDNKDLDNDSHRPRLSVGYGNEDGTNLLLCQ